MKKLTLQGLLPVILATVLSLLTSASINAQVAINTTGNAPDTSAMLDVSSNNRGVLLPRMTTAERTAIAQPADGLTVYDLSTTTYWYYDEERWNEIRNGSEKLLALDIMDNLPEPDFSCSELTSTLGIGDNPTAVAVSGNYAYVADRDANDIIVIDISDPEAPIIVSSLGVGSQPIDVVVSGNFLYVAHRADARLRVIDVSNPLTPTLVGSLLTGGLHVALEVEGDFVYLLSGISKDLRIIDVSVPSTPTLINSISFTGGIGINPFPVDFALANGFVYAIDNGDNQLRIIDVSDPNNLFFTGNLSLGNDPREIKVSGNFAYISDDNTFKVVEVTDPASPIQVASLSFTLIDEISVVNNYAFLDSNDTIRIVDINDPLSPTPIQNIVTFRSSVEDMVVSSNYLYQVDAANNDFKTIQLYCRDNVVGINPLTGMLEATELESDDLGNHIATTNLDLAGFDLNNGGNISAARGNIGMINLGAEGRVQGQSNAAGKGFTATPWVYTNVIEAQDERNDSRSTYITIGDNGRVGNPGQINLVTNGGNRMRISSLGFVGISRDPTTQLLEVGGNASKSNPGEWLGNSDARLKKNITALDPSVTLEKLLALRGITYEWNDDRTDYERPEGIQYGFTAQNIQEVFPTLVEEDAEGYLQTAYGTYDAMYVEALRALQQQVDALRTENQQLQQQVARIQEVEATLATLQQQLSSLDHSVTNKK